MQTVNFNCPHCGNLMAVGLNLLGRNVRCPHCKQVVRAPSPIGEPPVPAPTPAPPPQPAPAPTTPTVPVPAFNVPKPTETHESIFSERREHDEDLFGSEEPKPKLPQSPPVPSGSAARTMEETVPVPAPPEHLESSVNRTPLEITTQSAPPIFEPLPDEPPEVDGEPTPRRGHPPVESPVRGYQPRVRREQAASTPAFTWMLLAYAALVTAVAGFFGYQYFTAGSSGDHPFQAIPDFYGEYEKANRKQTSFKNLPDPKLDVPPQLRVKLGDELRVGDLLVRPTSVDRQLVTGTTESIAEGGDRTRELRPVTLVLTLRVKNMSADTTFHPNDPAFNRAGDQKPLPYTALQVNREFYYGPFHWPSETGTKREFIVGHEPDRDPLAPGQERDTWVTVAPHGLRTSTNANDVTTAINDLRPGTPLLWRVQLRRGLVKAPGPDGKDVEVSATTVIGVEFRADQIK